MTAMEQARAASDVQAIAWREARKCELDIFPPRSNVIIMCPGTSNVWIPNPPDANASHRRRDETTGQQAQPHAEVHSKMNGLR